MADKERQMTGWRSAFALYLDKRILSVLVLGFASGVPLLLTGNTLSAWLAKDGVSRTSIGLFALVGLPYALKFLWSPLIDRMAPPLPLGRRRGWGVSIQIALIGAVLALGTCDPGRELGLMALLAFLVAFLSASQDIVIDAYRVEILAEEQQGAGAAVTQTGYRLAMLASGAGALVVAQHFGWFWAYAGMALAIGAGMAVLLIRPEPVVPARMAGGKAGTGTLPWLKQAVLDPFLDFANRPRWPLVLVFVVTYKLGEAMAGIMATPLYIALGFSLSEIAAVSKVFGFAATILGSLIGGVMVARLGTLRALLVCGILQSLGNLFYVVQAEAGHQIPYLALCVFAENLTSGMAGSALVAYISGLCNLSYTATQYALLSSLTALGRTVFASGAGAMAQSLGWVPFFLLTTVFTLPALGLLLVLMRRPAEPPPPPPGTGSPYQGGVVSHADER